MWDIPVITDRKILANRPDVVLHDKTENTCLLIGIAIPSDSKINTKGVKKVKQVQRPGHRGQQNENSKDRNCARCNWSIRNNKEAIISEPSVVPR
jgi:hypothetical protein